MQLEFVENDVAAKNTNKKTVAKKTKRGKFVRVVVVALNFGLWYVK